MGTAGVLGVNLVSATSMAGDSIVGGLDVTETSSIGDDLSVGSGSGLGTTGALVTGSGISSSVFGTEGLSVRGICIHKLVNMPLQHSTINFYFICHWPQLLYHPAYNPVGSISVVPDQHCLYRNDYHDTASVSSVVRVHNPLLTASVGPIVSESFF